MMNYRTTNLGESESSSENDALDLNATQIAGVVEDWQKKLLQLDRRNRLLYFKPGRTAALIDGHTPDSIAKALDNSRRGLKFDFVETRRRRGGDRDDEREAIRGDLRSDCPTAELQRRLNNLRRRSREWQEEQGLNVLSMALGMLHWIDRDGVEAASPLLLLPAQLDKSSPSEPFVLSEDDDDIAGNPTLAEKLRQDFNLELPDYDGNVKPSEYLNRVRSLVKSRSGWSVEESAYLSVFAYSKLAMWQDLDRVRQKGTSHAIVRALAGDAAARVESSSTPGAVPIDDMERQVAGGLDDLLDIRDLYAVMDADYSQLIAIEAAKSGMNLVIHGPPGTGKSQTIANIISAMIAAGKTVLFVSEKTAALDVVKRRLDDVGLGVFCLDLHSERGGKASVYDQLRQSVNDARRVSPDEYDYESLIALRDRLNRTVRALHNERQPMNESAFRMHGRFAQLRDKPHAGFDVKDVGGMSSGMFAKILSAAESIARHPKEYSEHHTSRWRTLKMETPSLELPNTIREDMRELVWAVERLAGDTSSIGLELGLGAPSSRGRVSEIREIADQLSDAPGVPRKWLTPKASAGLRKIAGEDARLQRARQDRLDRLAPYFGKDVPEWDFASLLDRVKLEPGERQLLEQLLGAGYSALLMRPELATFNALELLKAALDDLRNAANDLAAFMQAESPATLSEIAERIATAHRAAELSPVPERLLASGAMERVKAVVDDARYRAGELTEREHELFSDFEESLLDSVDQNMLVRYRTEHQSGLRRFFSGSYKRDRNLLRGMKVKPGKMSFEDERSAVELAVRVNNLQRDWESGENDRWELFGRLYERRNTDWDGVIEYVSSVWELIHSWHGYPQYAATILTDRQRGLECGRRAADADRLLRHTWALMVSMGMHGQAAGPSDSAVIPSELSDLLNQCAPTLNRLKGVVEGPARVSLKRIDDLDALGSILEDGTNLRRMERDQESVADARRADFGARYAGFDTDWHEIRDALVWVDELRGLLGKGRVSDALARHCSEPLTPERYEDMASELDRAAGEFDNLIRLMEDRFDFEVGDWSEWDDAPFENIVAWANDLSEQADTASDWLIYQAAARELESATSAKAFDTILAVSADAEDVPDVVERRITSAWLDWVYSTEPVLANFTSASQDDARAKFKELDELLPLAAQNEARRRVFGNMPSTGSASMAAGQLGILNRELAKRRRQLPVKQLITRIPSLIGAIKPCFMMSPLAVSQYLPISDLESETLGFDAVIFDEASQVFPEDAIPAILRGKQIVLAGDQKQLPPTAFFRSGAGDSDDYGDDDYEEQPDQLADMESILDAAVGQTGSLFTEAHLNVHYRSRDERLIQFSNHHFYEDRLLTFPSPGHRNGWLGMNDVYVQDGVFENRVNRVEAEKVADMVVEHMRTRPVGESVGVVAMSRSQADLISQLIDERRLDERDLDARFAEDVAEPFFVKNLENVQGDERDHMILCVGYGPDPLGRTYNRFGPINAEGGQRRLNVAITRAKLRLSVVHSIKASDITASSQGARLLRRFLEYAANPDTSIHGEATIDAGAEYESPFEASVGRALIERGYRVEKQVGAARYRVDLAIMANDGAGIDLGIECDGAAYHSSPAARDRDWLRQRVLEGLGWRIHRVWSTSWVRNPENEIDAIEAALEEARSSPVLPFTPAQPSPAAPQTESEDTPPGVGVEVPGRDGAEFDEYVKAELSAFHPSELAAQIIRVADVEGPVHTEIVIKRISDRRRDRQGREWLKSVIASETADGHIHSRDEFVWSDDEQLTRRPRKPGADGERRTIDQISRDELRMAVLATVRQMYGGSQSEVVSQTARNLGYRRTGNLIEQRLSGVLDEMLNDGALKRSFGSIVAHSSSS